MAGKHYTININFILLSNNIFYIINTKLLLIIIKLFYKLKYYLLIITTLTKKFLTSVSLLTFVENVVSSASKTGLDTVFLNFSALENSAFCRTWIVCLEIL